jgi:hypothetical protein
MGFSSWLRNRKRFVPTARRRTQTSPRQRANFRPMLEALEDRTLLSTYTATTGSDLIADINAANQAGGSNTIYLAANTTFDLTAVNNTTNGANGLPVISGAGKKVAADNLTIIGSDPAGDIIQRDPSSTTLALRLFDVAPGASLTLENVTLQDGLASGSGAAADGGAIYNQGTLTLLNTIVQNNTAQGSNGAPAEVKSRNQVVPAQAGADAEGGGIWTNGTVKLEGGTIIGTTHVPYPPLSGAGNKAIGGNGGHTYYSSSVANGGAGGGGFGGGLYQAGGSVTITNATVAGNLAVGGVGGSIFYSRRGINLIGGTGGAAAGGGLDVAGGTLSMSNDTVKTNFAQGGSGGGFTGQARGGTGGAGSGGGIYVGGGTVTLQAINLSGNQATGGRGGRVNVTNLGSNGADAGLSGNGLGGGLYVGGGVVTMTSSMVNGNATYAGMGGSNGVPNGSPGVASGGGMYIVASASVSLDSFTVTNTTHNYDNNWNGLSYIQTGDDIDGSYTLI